VLKLPGTSLDAVLAEAAAALGDSDDPDMALPDAYPH